MTESIDGKNLAYSVSMLIGDMKHGDMEGRCALCGMDTEDGTSLRDVVSGNFSGASRLFCGDITCSWCTAFLLEPMYRRRSWLAGSGDVRFGTFREIARIALNGYRPHEEDIYVYLNRSGKKQGWLGHMSAVTLAGSRSVSIVTDLFDDVVRCDLRTAKYFEKIQNILRKEFKATKKGMRSGQYRSTTWRRAMALDLRSVLEAAKGFAGNPTWEVMTHVVE